MPFATSIAQANLLTSFVNNKLPDLQVDTSGSSVEIVGSPNDKKAILATLDEFESLVSQHIKALSDQANADLRAMPNNAAVYNLSKSLRKYDWEKQNGAAEPIVQTRSYEWDDPNATHMASGGLIGFVAGLLIASLGLLARRNSALKARASTV